MMRAERGMLNTLRGNCHTAVAGLARIKQGILHLEAKVMSPDGGKQISAEGTVASLSDAEALGRTVGETLLENGAGAYIG